MRNFRVFINDVARKPPFIMPFIGVAHILWLLWAIWGNRYFPIISMPWLQVIWLIAYIVCWVAACDLRKWGALGYILLTLLNVSLYLLIKDVYHRDMYVSNLFLLDGMFSFFLLYFFKLFH